jgi:hypothetical protein
MAISTQDIELNDPLRNIVADSTAVFDELSSKQTGYGSGDGLNVASKLDDAEDDDEDDDDEEEEEDEDFDEEGDDEEDEDDEEEDDDDEDDETRKMRMRTTMMKMTTRTKYQFRSGVSLDWLMS